MDIFKKNRFFKFASSVKLAVPLMSIMTLVVAAGTIIESKYNADMAKLLIYQSRWFLLLLGLLFTNILLATLSRIPFKKHHTGFVITHIGLLTLLTGSMLTSVFGVDGQLRIEEKATSNEVVLPDLSFELVNRQTGESVVVPLERSLSDLTLEDLSSLNKAFGGKVSLQSYMAFAKTEKVYEKDLSGKGPLALQFGLKSNFFDVKEWLHAEKNPHMQMGSASLALVVHSKKNKSQNVPTSAGKARFIILDYKSKSKIKELTLDELKAGVQIGGVKINLIKAYEQATVGAKNKLEEGGRFGGNPALELSVEHKGNVLREITYAKFPEFSLQPQGLFGYSFRFVAGEQKDMSQFGKASGNVIEFHVYDDKPEQALLQLSKNGKKELEQWIKPGDTVQTPWMGMRITLSQIIQGGVESWQVTKAKPLQGLELPPSALKVRLRGSPEAVWMLEGDVKDVSIDSQLYQMYYGRKIMRLPFEIYLEKFSKVDYPGTQTPMSFESLVKVNGQEPSLKISMNEPLNQSGYTLYQSSYIMQPGMPIYSVFSVNLDPGRPVKYAGSLILVLGIIVFTLMRSRLGKTPRRTNT